MKIDDYITLIYKELKGEITPDEKVQLLKVYGQSDEMKELYQDVKLSWDISGGHLITTQEVESDLEKLYQSIKKSPVKVKSLWPNLAKIAAILIVFVTVGFFIQRSIINQEIEIFAEVNKEIVLPDGSTVWMEKGSVLTYSKDFIEERNISLDGRANFQVTHDASHPFEVSVYDAKVTVLGTRFTVNDHNNRIVVSVNEGRVKLTNKSSSVILVENELGFCSDFDADPEKMQLKTSNFEHWMNDQFRFEGETLGQIVEQLRYIFDIEVSLENETMKDCTISAVFNNIDGQEVISKLASYFDMELVQTNKNLFTLKNGECK